MRGLCVTVTIALPAPALAAGHKAVFLPRRELGRLLVAEGQQGWCLHWVLGGRAEGLCHCYSFFPEVFECSCFLSLVLPSLLDRLGDSKDSVREQDQTLLLKIMEQAANPQVCSTQHEWLAVSGKGNLFSVRFSLPFFCLKWLQLPTPCYKVFALLGKAVAWYTWERVSGFPKDGMGTCQCYCSSLWKVLAFCKYEYCFR